MEQKSGFRLLSKRNVFGAILIAGIAAGIYLGDLWKGFGGGNTLGLGTSDSKSTPSSTSDSKKDAKTEHPVTKSKSEGKLSGTREVLEVVIVDRSYFIRTADGDSPAELKQLVELAKTTTGDTYGIRVRIYRKETSRASAEVDLKDALKEAGITERQTFCDVDPITD